MLEVKFLLLFSHSHPLASFSLLPSLTCQGITNSFEIEIVRDSHATMVSGALSSARGGKRKSPRVSPRELRDEEGEKDKPSFSSSSSSITHIFCCDNSQAKLDWLATFRDLLSTYRTQRLRRDKVLLEFPFFLFSFFFFHFSFFSFYPFILFFFLFISSSKCLFFFCLFLEIPIPSPFSFLQTAQQLASDQFVLPPEKMHLLKSSELAVVEGSFFLFFFPYSRSLFSSLPLNQYSPFFSSPRQPYPPSPRSHGGGKIAENVGKAGGKEGLTRGGVDFEGRKLCL